MTRNVEVPKHWGKFNSHGISLAYPPGWKRKNPPFSKGAMLCVTDMETVMLEVFGFRTGLQHELLPAFLANQLVGFAPFSPDYTDGRVLSHTNVEIAAGVSCHHVKVSYGERGEQFYVHYVVVGTRLESIQIAMKCLESQASALQADFETVVQSLRTHWLPNGIPV